MSGQPPHCMSDYDPDSLSIDDVIARIETLITPIKAMESLPLAEALGRTAATDFTAPLAVPVARNSAMDGYAVRYDDLSGDKPTHLRVIGKSLAGHPYTGALQPGEAVRITTGALVPTHADCVVMQEITQRDDEHLTIDLTNHRRGQFVREVGSDIAEGDVLLERGTRLGAAQLGLLASVGVADVSVLRKVRVALFSTGDELQPPGTVLQAGQIYDSNRFTLRGLFIQAGCEVVDLGIVADHPRALENTFEAAKACDLIVSTGGVSVGEADFVRQVLQQQGTLHAWKVAMKPGRPLTVGQLAEHALYFGLPGNPVSGMITFYLFVAMALRALHGRSKYTPVTMSAVCSNTLKKMPGRVEYQRGILYRDLDQRWSVKTTGRQDSHVLTSMHEANCLIVLGIDSDGAQCGERVEVIPYSELRAVLDA